MSANDPNDELLPGSERTTKMQLRASFDTMFRRVLKMSRE
jgi:hypothetical protein